jgi:hypothetical protein
MARQEQDCEDLLREARALVERIEVRTASEPEPVVIGFRRDGAASVYFGASPAYHFNARNELRRAYVGDQLWKAQAGRLVTMKRERGANEVKLLTREISETEQQSALDALRTQLSQLATDLSTAERHTVIGQVPEDRDVFARVLAWLRELPEEIVVAERPNVG